MVFLVCFSLGNSPVRIETGCQTVSCKIYYEKCQQIHVAYDFEQYFILEWNPGVCPKYAMVDYDNAETTSLEEVFPDIQVFLCDFLSRAVLA